MIRVLGSGTVNNWALEVGPASLTVDAADDVYTWTCALECLDTHATGWACFDEHYGEVDVVWS
jgi:hypothetical protein